MWVNSRTRASAWSNWCVRPIYLCTRAHIRTHAHTHTYKPRVSHSCRFGSQRHWAKLEMIQRDNKSLIMGAINVTRYGRLVSSKHSWDYHSIDLPMTETIDWCHSCAQRPNVRVGDIAIIITTTTSINGPHLLVQVTKRYWYGLVCSCCWWNLPGCPIWSNSFVIARARCRWIKSKRVLRNITRQDQAIGLDEWTRDFGWTLWPLRRYG